MSGQVTTSAQGSIAALGLSVALVGAAVTCSQGRVDPIQHGQVFYAQQGSASLNVSVPLSGSAATFSTGTLSPQGQQPALVGQGMTASAGILSPFGHDLTLPLTGQDVFTATGFVTGGYAFLSGIGATFAQGAFGLSTTVPLTGSQSVFAAGNVIPQLQADDTFIQSGQGSASAFYAVPLVGSASTTAQGTLTVTGDASLPLTGSASTSATGSVGFSFSFPLTGSQINSAQQSMGAPGGASLTGAQFQAIGGTVFVTPDRTFPLTGQQFQAVDGVTFASSLAFPLGESLTAFQGDIGPRTVGLIGAEIQSFTGIVSPPPPLVVSTGGGGDSRKKKRIKPETIESPAVLARAKAQKEQLDEIEASTPKVEIPADLSPEEEIALILALLK